ncbi:NAD(P)H-dependent glycerol-3-phosphate dehydrogenase [candidate division KSB1 bacterium]
MARKTKSHSAEVTVLGGGSWGTALALLLDGKGCAATLWEFNKELAERLRTERENKTFLPGVKVPESITVTSALDEAVAASDYIVFVVPSHVLRSVARNVVECGAENKKIVSATKGIENDSLLRMSEVLLEEIPGLTPDNVAVLSGPSFAAEVAREIPTTVVAASAVEHYSREIQQLFMCPTFRVYASTDIVGVELGGSFKNVIAIATGILDGIGWGDNTKAALLTRALVEMTRLGEKMGAKKTTFSGLSGAGDLILTCMGKLSRNLHVGREIGKGRTLQEILDEMVMIAEGVKTTRSVHQLSRREGVETPIMEQVYEVLFRSKSPKEAVLELMTREAKAEH